MRRYMRGFDADDHRSVYVDILAQLHEGGLSRYDGTVTLSSWVMVVARSRCLDAVRARHGRKRVPAWLQKLTALDREVYRLFYLEGHDVSTTLSELRRLQYSVGAEDVAAILDKLDAKIDRRLRAQLAYELQARSVGGTTARLLAFLDDLRQHAEEVQESSRPDTAVIEKEARATLAQLRWHVEHLPPDERRAVDLYYWGGLRAEDVAARMGLAGHRPARGLIRRAIGRLRRNLNVEGHGVAHPPVSNALEFPAGSAGGGEQRKTGP